MRSTGPSLLLVGFVVALTPHVTALLFGRYVLKMNPVILLGACAGAGTVTAALRAIQDEAGSKLPVLGYTVPYAHRQHPAHRLGPGHRHAHPLSALLSRAARLDERRVPPQALGVAPLCLSAVLGVAEGALGGPLQAP